MKKGECFEGNEPTLWKKGNICGHHALHPKIRQSSSDQTAREGGVLRERQ